MDLDRVHLPLDRLREAPWNANEMDEAMKQRLRQSIKHFGLVVPLVVRQPGEGVYETIGGAQRLAVLRGMGFTVIHCVIVEADDTEARLLSQALNRIQGEDDLGLRAELLRAALAAVSQETVLCLLPETAQSLQAMASLGHQDMASYLEDWQKAQGARLKHLQLQLTPVQLEVVEEALARFIPRSRPIPGTGISRAAPWMLRKGCSTSCARAVAGRPSASTVRKVEASTPTPSPSDRCSSTSLTTRPGTSST